jgi:hypothetical protein
MRNSRETLTCAFLHAHAVFVVVAQTPALALAPSTCPQQQPMSLALPGSSSQARAGAPLPAAISTGAQGATSDDAGPSKRLRCDSSVAQQAEVQAALLKNNSSFKASQVRNWLGLESVCCCTACDACWCC